MRQRNTAPLQTKLRDSCEICASAKVKCSKEKPVCQRCRERRLNCEYGASRRHGRGPQTNETVTVPTATRTDSSESSSSDNSSGSNTDIKLQNDKAIDTDGDASISSLLNFSPAGDPMDVTQTLPDIPDLDADPGLFSLQDWDMSNDPFNMALLGWDGGSEMSDIERSNAQQGRKCTIAHCCLETILELLRKLSINDALKGHRPEPEPEAPTTLVSLEAVTAQHKGTLQSLANVLDCTCSLNGNLLTLLYMVTFKLIAWYAIAVHNLRRLEAQTPGTVTPSNAPFQLRDLVQDCPPGFDRMINGGRMPRDEETRAAAQSVLEDLYHIQDLSDRIAKRTEAARSNGKSPAPKLEDCLEKDAQQSTEVEVVISNTAPLLSEPVANRFMTDLRHRLRAVSFEVISVLLRE